MSQPLNCPSLCEIEKKYNITRRETSNSETRYNSCMSDYCMMVDPKFKPACSSFCENEKKDPNMLYNECMSDCNNNNSNPRTIWPCLLASRDLTPENLDDKVNKCADSLNPR